MLHNRWRARLDANLVFRTVQFLHLDHYNRCPVRAWMVLSEVCCVLPPAGMAWSRDMAFVVPLRSRWYVELTESAHYIFR